MHDEGNPCRLFIGLLVRAHGVLEDLLAVIRGHDDERVVEEAKLAEYKERMEKELTEFDEGF